MKMTARTCFVLFLTLTTLQVAAGQNTKRGPSTPEERQKAVLLARSLEQEPFGKDAKVAREWFTLWLIEVPDITVKFCTDVLAPGLDGEKSPLNEVVVQMLYSETAFIIENPKKARDNLAIYVAGVEGSLKVYEAILKVQPDARSPLLDKVIEKRNNGQLVDYVRQAMKKCK